MSSAEFRLLNSRGPVLDTAGDVRRMVSLAAI